MYHTFVICDSFDNFICINVHIICHESVFNDNDVRVTEELLMPWFK